MYYSIHFNLYNGLSACFAEKTGESALDEIKHGKVKCNNKKDMNS